MTERNESITINGAFVELELIEQDGAEFVTAKVDGSLLAAISLHQPVYPFLDASELAMSCVAHRLDQRRHVSSLRHSAA
jgi:hypothetical protein